MTTRLRTHAAAALLLLPLGLAMVAEPAAAQHGGTVVAQASLVERFVMRPQGRLHDGQEVRFRLSGAAGGRAWVDVPGVVSGLNLAETRAGVYEGSYVIRRGDNLDAFPRAVATLQTGSQRASAQLDQRGRGRDRDERQARDERPPQVVDVAPDQGARVTARGKTRIAAKLEDRGRAGIDPASVQLRVDGRDVTRAARLTASGIEYHEDLRPGRHSAEVSLRDRSGNVTRHAWSFDVLDDDRLARPSVPVRPIAIPLQITSHYNNMVVDARQPLTIQGRTAPNAVVRLQVVSALMRINRPPLAEHTVRADSGGNFIVQVQPLLSGDVQGARFEVRVRSTLPNGRAVEQRLNVLQQG